MSEPESLPSGDRIPPPDFPAVASATEDAPERRYPFWTWGDVLVFFGLLLACLFAAAGVTHLVLVATGMKGVRPSVLMIVAQFIAFAAATGVLAAMLRVRYGAPFWRSLAWHFDKWSVVPYFVGGIALALGVSIFNVLLRTRPIKSELEEIMRDPTGAPLLIVLGITLAPFFEELFFRGFLQPLLVRSIGTPLGLLVSGTVFASLHGPQYKWSWRYLLSVMLAGVMFALVRHRTGSTANSALMHAGYNSTFFAVFLLFQRGSV